MGFIKEEKGQAGLEYILLIGGIIMAAVIIFAIYSSMTQRAVERLNASAGGASSVMSSKISAEIAGI